jgi:hypothetical protein
MNEYEAKVKRRMRELRAAFGYESGTGGGDVLPEGAHAVVVEDTDLDDLENYVEVPEAGQEMAAVGGRPVVLNEDGDHMYADTHELVDPDSGCPEYEEMD